MGVEEREIAPGRDGTPGRASLATRSLDRLSLWDEAVRSRWPFSALVGADLPPDRVPGDGSSLLVRPAILGFIAICAITAGVAQGQSPFTLKEPGAWFFGVPTSNNAAPAHAGPGLFFGLVAVYGGLVLLMRVWYGLIRTLGRSRACPSAR